jgi:hypothetical protein
MAPVARPKLWTSRRLRRRPARLARTLFAVLAAGLWLAGAAHATDTVTATAPSPVTLGSSSTVAVPGAAVQDTTNASQTLQVTVSSTLGTLTLPSNTSSLTLAYGYSSFSGPTFTFTGTAANANAALADMELTGGGTTGTATISVNVTPSVAGVYYLPATGHYYQFVTAGSVTSWTGAATAANTLSFDGQEGYLAAVPNATVNDFIDNHLGSGDTNIWAGGQASDFSGGTGPNGSYRAWYWGGQSASSTPGQSHYGGPLAGQIFTECTNLQGNCAFQNTAPFFYDSSSLGSGVWYYAGSDQEPNNSGGIESYLVINYSSDPGKWNDIDNTNGAGEQGYVVEYGDETTGASSWSGSASASSSSTLATAPDAPTGVTASPGATGSDSLAVSWSAPASDGNSAITGYTVTATPTSTGSVQTCTTNGALSCTVTGLQPGAQYTVSVTATNTIGTGGPAATTANAPFALPGAPTGLSASPGSAGSGDVTVSWSPPASNGGSAVNGYSVTATPASGPAQTCSTTGATTCTLTGLAASTTYGVSITDTTAVGTSSPATTSVTSPAATVPASPTGVSASPGAYGSAQVTVSWTAPYNGDSPITGYTVTATPASGPVQTCTTTSTTTCTVTTLQPGAAYTITVTATNVVGTGGAGSTSASAPASAPDAPTGLTATPGATGTGTITLSWSAPAGTGGSPITGYSVTATPTGTGSVRSCTTTVALSCALTGLTPGSAYTLAVSATNVAGSGNALATIASAPADLPTAPTSITAAPGAPGSSEMAVSWAAPSSDGGSPVTGYTATATPTTGGSAAQTCTTSGATIAGLDPSVAYTVTVTATTAAGTGANATTFATAPATTIPDAPSGLTAVPGAPGSGAVTLTWTAPAVDGGSAILSYTVVTSSTADATSYSCTPATLAPTTCTVTGLQAGVNYTFTLAAVNAVGSSATIAVTARAPGAVSTIPTSPSPVAGVAAAPAATVRAGLTTSAAGTLSVPLACSGLGDCTIDATLTTPGIGAGKTLQLGRFSGVVIGPGSLVPVPTSITPAARRELYKRAAYRVRVTLTVDSHLADGETAVSVQRIWMNVSAITGCQDDVGRLSAQRVGRLRIGMRRRAALRLGRHWRTGPSGVRFAVAGGAIRAVFPNAALLRTVSARRRAGDASRVMLILTGNRHYVAGGIKAGMTVTQAHRALHLGRAIAVGAHTWYLVRIPRGTLVLQARRGVIREVGVASRAFTGTRARDVRLVHHF